MSDDRIRTNRRDEIALKIVTSVKKMEAEASRGGGRALLYWRSADPGKLGIKTRTEILVQCLAQAKRRTDTEIAHALDAILIRNPPLKRSSGHTISRDRGRPVMA